MIKVKNVTKYYENERILNNISFVLDKGHKVALAGFNGVGKTTLLKMIVGELPVEKGSVEVNKNITISFLPQDPYEHNKEKVVDFLERASLDSYKKSALFYRDIEIMFAGFGLKSEIKNEIIGKLSSGQKTKIFLISVLLSKADVILLDEPTNNLDLPALIWLEQFLRKIKSSFIVVSHDKTFLDNVANKVFEIDWKTRRLEIVNGRYSGYINRRQKEFNKTLRQHEEQREYVKRLRELVKSKKRKAEKGSKHVTPDNDHMLQGYRRNRSSNSLKDASVLQNRIKRMNVINKPEDRKVFNIQIDSEDSELPRDISIKNLVCGYEDGFRVGPVNLDIPFGSRIFILGLNGAGKSTILKTITGLIPKITGEILVGGGVKFGNLMQEHQSLNEQETALEYLVRRVKSDKENLENHLSRFGFSENQVNKKIEKLSPGDWARLLLSYFSAVNVNTLVLDEPTNHLDIETESALQKTLTRFEGTAIIVTHNRNLVGKIHNEEIYVLEGSKLKRISRLKDYLVEMEKKSKKLIRMLNFF